MKNCNYKRLVILLTTSVLSTACVFRQTAAPVLNGEDEISTTDAPYQPSDSTVKTATFAAGKTVAGNSAPANISAPKAYSNRLSDSNVASSSVVANGHFPAHQSENGTNYLPSNAPVDLNARTHTVVRGDTVYNLAKRYHILQNDLRTWNSLPDDTISVGQVLKVKPSESSTGNASATLQPPHPVSQTSRSATLTTPTGSTQAQAPSTYTVSSKPHTVEGITWIRPVAGVLTSRFNTRDRGVTIAGNLGAPIVAVADGKVIYSSQLSSYGNLVIIQHNDQYLTAYAHNQVNLVKEGVQVKRGQRIALMGNTGDASKVALHFELRRNGQAIDPAPYIPL